MKQLTHGSLFAGIGGFDLGFERAGIKTVWQVEIDPFCRKVLEKHWPNVQRFDDIRECGAANLERVDIICGGFPCQDISHAGRQAGIDGERSGLWREYARIISELRPRFAVVENVAALLGRGIERVVGDLAEIGYDAEWKIISAADVGAQHIRERVWIVAYPASDLRRTSWDDTPESSNGRSQVVADPECAERRPHGSSRNGLARQERISQRQEGAGRIGIGSEAIPDATRAGLSQPRNTGRTTAQACRIFAGTTVNRSDWWAVEPDVGRVANGIPARVDRLKGLGNAVVPQIAEWIGRRIVAASNL